MASNHDQVETPGHARESLMTARECAAVLSATVAEAETVADAVYGTKEFTGEQPNKIALHRDGFMNDPIDAVRDFLDQEGVEYDIVEVRKQAPARIVDAAEFDEDVGTLRSPEKGMACISQHTPQAYLATVGRGHNVMGANKTPRPITVKREHGTTDIATLASQVYLLTQCHVGAFNTTLRKPITTHYADAAAEAAANDELTQTNGLVRGIGFI
jgi:argonaute-like protein implicated in RNA metabolism and viral defense